MAVFVKRMPPFIFTRLLTRSQFKRVQVHYFIPGGNKILKNFSITSSQAYTAVSARNPVLEPNTEPTLVAVHLAASVVLSVSSREFYPVDLQEVLPDLSINGQDLRLQNTKRKSVHLLGNFHFLELGVKIKQSCVCSAIFFSEKQAGKQRSWAQSSNRFL